MDAGIAAAGSLLPRLSARPRAIHRRVFSYRLDYQRGRSQRPHTNCPTTDGYLWLGTQTGLIRFDGVTFQQYLPADGNLPSNTVSTLLATPDGGLWIGFAPHGAAFLKAGRIIRYGQSEGMPLATAFGFARTADGTIWVGTSRGLWRLEGAHWQSARARWSFPDVNVEQLFVDGAGTLWVSTSDGLFRLPSGAEQFERSAGRSVRLAQTRDGTLWRAEDHRYLRSVTNGGDSSAAVRFELDANQLLVDRDNSLWVITGANGIARIAKPEKSAARDLEHFTQKDGLSDNRVTFAFEDREGNIWVATRGGLDRFRPRNVVPGLFPYGSEGQDLALVEDREGGIWAGNLGQPLMRFAGGTMQVQVDTQGISCAYREPDGTIWFGGFSSLARVAGGRYESVPFPSEVPAGETWPVQAIVRDSAGGLWVSVQQNGVFRQFEGVWTRWGGVEQLPQRTPTVMFTGGDGRTWFGYTDDEAAVLDHNAVRTFSQPEGLKVGTLTAINQVHRRIWIGGQFGLVVFDGQRFRPVSTALAGGFNGVSGIVETANGDLWVNQSSGLAHFAAAEVDATLRDFRRSLHGQIFDFWDGVPGAASPIRPLPSVILAHDGRIWLTGTSGAAWIDPAHTYRNPVPPPVAVEAIVADGRGYDPRTPAKLPVLPSNVRIDYTALSLSMPERVEFRYWLVGHDTGWQEFVTRRSAFYTNLKPGEYRFRVIACITTESGTNPGHRWRSRYHRHSFRPRGSKRSPSPPELLFSGASTFCACVKSRHRCKAASGSGRASGSESRANCTIRFCRASRA